MHYYEILPLTTTGAGDTTFTYQSTEPLKIGALASIQLRNRYVKGLVITEVKKPTFTTKEIKKVLSNEPILSEIQMGLAKQISEYYLASLGETIDCMFPFEFGKKRRVPKEAVKPTTNKFQTELKLTIDQNKIFKAIKSAKPASKHLLFGVTGSGKTEIYLQLTAEALSKGQGVIILVPEISLTPQTLNRFRARFGDTVAVWHSHLKETEKYHNWELLKSGQARIVLGARSAIFAPIDNVGYIFIDEEHEGSYKQDQNPRYEAGRVAEWLADASGAKLVVGSATPKIETYHKVESGEYNLCSLEKRIVSEGLPPVKVVNLTDEFRKGNKSIISDDLYEAANEALKDGKQVMLFVNRRGAATFVVCRDCGHVLECPHCEIPLTYHPHEGERLFCHHCGFNQPVPSVCPNCQSHAIRYFGLGTQRAEMEVKKLFPKARVARMDRDTTQKRGSHEEIYTTFANHESDIIIGTQMIAKGWDLPNVAVVGVISADTMLNLPDFRSSERTFDMLTQVAGRTGRGFHPGQVFIQTYAPENYAIIAAADHNFLEFYRREIKERLKYNYPPFTQLIKLTLAHKSEQTAALKAEEQAEKLKTAFNDKKITLLGPNPSFMPKIAGKYRYQIILKLEIGAWKLELKDALLESIRSGWTVDVNPDSLL